MKSTTPQTEFIMLQSLLSAKLTKRVEGQLSFHGISFTEYLILHFLNEAPQKTMRRIDLAECVGISASGVTRLLAPMEKRKLVEKEANARDARVSLVKISKAGERIYKEASVSFEHSAQFLSERLSEKQLTALLEFSRRLV
jgi:DNA-binding MarR family transcriptional regulator